MDRHLDFDAIENFRDFGGYATAAGAALKRGRLYRSGNHAYATEADLERLGAIAPAAIIDLRRPEERAREPSRRPPGFSGRVIENDIASEQPDWSVTVKAAGEPTPEWFFADALGYYRRVAFEARHLDLYRRYFQALAEADGPIVVHCAAGKDRTGLICALTHHLAGVHRDDIVEDYLLTNDESRLGRKIAFLGPWLEAQLGVRCSEAALRVAVSVHPQYLETAFSEIEAAYGSIDGYLGQALGLDAIQRARIQARLLG
jgi:protein tyrosine/serine phosphatase